MRQLYPGYTHATLVEYRKTLIRLLRLPKGYSRIGDDTQAIVPRLLPILPRLLPIKYVQTIAMH